MAAPSTACCARERSSMRLRGADRGAHRRERTFAGVERAAGSTQPGNGCDKRRALGRPHERSWRSSRPAVSTISYHARRDRRCAASHHSLRSERLSSACGRRRVEEARAG